MKFFCEYCGNRIDAHVDNKCPNCGASYKKNKEFIKLHQEKQEQEQMNKEIKKEIFNHTMGVMKFAKVFKILPIIMILISIVSVMMFFLNINDKKNGSFSFVEDEVTVNFNEYGKTSKYGFKVTKYEVVENKFDTPEEGYEYVKFYFEVENLSNKELTKEDVYCIVDGISQTNDFTSGYSDIPMFIAKKLTVTGTSTFKVPKQAKDYYIRYGDYITVHIIR